MRELTEIPMNELTDAELDAVSGGIILESHPGQGHTTNSTALDPTNPTGRDKGWAVN